MRAKYARLYHVTSTFLSPKTPNQLYAYAITRSLLLGVFFLLYWGFRYGYVNLYIINKTFAAVSAMLLGWTLLIGPIARLFDRFDSMLLERKYIGIVAFFYALGHVVVSFFLIPDSYSLKTFFLLQPVPFYFGLSGFLLLFFLLVISNRKSLISMGGKNWFTAQSWGLRISIFAVFMHTFLVKINTWRQWFESLRPRVGVVHWEWPPIGMWIAAFFLMAVCVRVCERISIPLGRFSFVFFSLAFFIFCISTFIWGGMQRASLQ